MILLTLACLIFALLTGENCAAVTVDNLDAACERFNSLKVPFKKQLDQGSMKNIAFIMDPDGYWIEILQNERFTGKTNF